MLSSFITYLCCTVWHTDPAVPQDYLWLCPELGTHSFFRITTSKVTCRVLGLNWRGVVRLINIPPHTPFLMAWKKNATCPLPSSDYARLGSNPGPVLTFASQKFGLQERAPMYTFFIAIEIHKDTKNAIKINPQENLKYECIYFYCVNYNNYFIYSVIK